MNDSVHHQKVKLQPEVILQPEVFPVLTFIAKLAPGVDSENSTKYVNYESLLRCKHILYEYIDYTHHSTKY